MNEKAQEFKEMYQEEKVTKWLTIVVFALGMMVWTGYYSNYLGKRHMDNILNYCETVTGQKHAKFNGDGQFIGCETVVK